MKKQVVEIRKHLHLAATHWIPALRLLPQTSRLQTKYWQELLLLTYYQAREPQLPDNAPKIYHNHTSGISEGQKLSLRYINEINQETYSEH